MLKTTCVLLLTCTLLSACVSEPRDPAFAGVADIDKQAAAKTRVSLGLTYLKNGNFTQAKYNLDKALEFAPRSADPHFAIAYYYQQVEEFALADASYQTALSFDKNNPDIINSYGVFLCQQGNYEQAKTYFLRAVNSKSYISTAETYENLALCAQQQGLLDEALGYYNSALNHQPTRAKSLFLMAELQAEKQQFAEAKKTLWKHDRVAQPSAESLFLAYQIAQGLGDITSAVGYGELLKKNFPQHANTATYVRQMRKFQPVATIVPKPPTIETPQADIQAPAPQRQPETVKETPTIDVSNDYHIVKPKQNLYRISLLYGVKMQSLMAWNNIEDPSSIRIGMKLWLKDPNNNDK